MITLFKDPFFNALDRVLDDTYLKADRNFGSYKNTNITKNESEYKIQLAVPGLSKEDIKISLKESVLTISFDKEKTDDNFTFTSSFQRTYELPDDVDEKNISGSVENGVVEIILPKSKKKSVERLISLN
jgi:HSP20 family protein